MDANFIEKLIGIAAGLARLQMEIAAMLHAELAWRAKLKRVFKESLHEERPAERNHA